MNQIALFSTKTNFIVQISDQVQKLTGDLPDSFIKNEALKHKRDRKIYSEKKSKDRHV